MAWWERPLARLRGDRTPSAPTGTAPAVASVPAPGEWNDVPRLQRVLADPIAPVAINDDFRDSLASFGDPSLLAPLSHRVDPSVGGLVEGLAAPGRPQVHDGPDLVVPRSAPAAPTVQRRTTWGADATELAVVPLEYRHPVARATEEPSRPVNESAAAESAHPDDEPVGTGVTEPAATAPERAEADAPEPDAPLVMEAAPAPVAAQAAEPAGGPASSHLPVLHRHAEAFVTGPTAVQRTVLPEGSRAPTPAEVATGPAAAPGPGPRQEQPSVQRLAEPRHAALPVVSGGETRGPSPAARADVVPPVIPAATPSPSTRAPVVQRVGAPASEASPVTIPRSTQRAADEADAVAPGEPGFTEVPLVVAPAPGGPDAEAAWPGTPDAPDDASRPLLGEHAEPQDGPPPASQPVVQSLSAARDLPVATHPPAPRTTPDAPVLQRLPVSPPPAEIGSAATGSGAGGTIPGNPPDAASQDRPLPLRAPVVQRLSTELPGRARDDGPSAGGSSTGAPLPVATEPAGRPGRADPADAPAAERFLPPAAFAPPIAAVQRRTPGTPPDPHTATAAPVPSATPAPGVQRVTAEPPAAPQPQPPLMLVRSPSARAAGTGPALGEGMSFAAMFAGFAAESSESGYGGTDVQRQTAEAEPPAEPAVPAPSEPAAAPGAPAAAGTAGAVAAAGGGNIDELARRLYEPLAARLREELWLDRERAGWMTELA